MRVSDLLRQFLGPLLRSSENLFFALLYVIQAAAALLCWQIGYINSHVQLFRSSGHFPADTCLRTNLEPCRRRIKGLRVVNPVFTMTSKTHPSSAMTVCTQTLHFPHGSVRAVKPGRMGQSQRKERRRRRQSFWECLST